MMNSVWRMWSFEVSVYGAISWVFGTMGLAPGRVVCACRIDWGVRERQMVFEAMGVAEIDPGMRQGTYSLKGKSETGISVLSTA